uniref:Triadin-like n=1 Tax=Nicotiana tabacum TaxID=4097 RepID=A0A1S3XTC4_TOBAC|nr:PREDICTED: triadin-like [Nicotiana tabacum]
MTNPQDNPGTPPLPSLSNSTTPSPPSTSPKPRLRRLKILARNIVPSGAPRKKLNEKFKGSQGQNSSSSSDSESYQSAIEGEGPGSSDSEKPQESPSKVISSVSENLESRFILIGSVKDVEVPGSQRSGERVEESGMKSGGSSSREATKGLVHLSTQRDELVSSTKETLADLLKKVGASYDPKRRRTPTTKAPNVPKPSKKIKASSPTPTASSLPRGRATRSRVKQSEVDLQRALKESKKKKMDKGKGKIAEPSKAVEEEEMELVHQERGTLVEVPTPKPKNTKTFSKKSSFVSEAGEPTLDNRTRSGRLLKDLVEPRMMGLVDTLAAQGWKDMVLQMDGRLARNELIEFMANVAFDAKKLGEILDMPSEGFDDYTRQRWPCQDSLPAALAITMRFCDSEEVNEARAVQKSEMRPEHKVLSEFVNKCLLPRQERRHIANYMDLVLMECLEKGKQIN